ncbi:hypothetical protein V1514DRAFT_354450 [Lipomyces japonicus]|uniref:uncharacterized protein n=1 Tax=Lipomyces japonicus TaxID=56871 RepID=UPI0034CF6E60
MLTKAGPELPPHIIEARRLRRLAAQASTTTNDERSPKRMKTEDKDVAAGELDAYSSDYDDGGNEFGPTLPQDIDEEKEEVEARKRLARYAEKEAVETKIQVSKREEWMTVPPSEADWAASQADPTKLKNKRFSSGPGATLRRGLDPTWTESEVERKKRLGEEMMGLRQKADESGSINRSSRSGFRDEALDRRVQQYNEQVRGKSLLEQHQDSLGSKSGKANNNNNNNDDDIAADDPSKRRFDYQKDIASGGRIMDASALQRITKNAGSIDSKFAKGQYL